MPRFANRHGVAGLLYDEIVESGANPSDTRWIVKLSGYAQKQRKRYDLHKDAIASLARFYSKHDIKMLVFKGYALSLLYDVPENRKSGDVDIYLFGEGEKADSILQTNGIKVNLQEDKHSTFDIKGVHFENHATFLDLRGNKNMKIAETYLEKEIKSKYSGANNINNIFLPTPNFNALFLPLHFAQHWVSYETSFRMLYDWSVFLQKCSKDVDWNEVYIIIEKIGFAHYFNALNLITIETFNISNVTLPNVNADKKLADKILHDTMNPTSVVDIPQNGRFFMSTIMKSFRYYKLNKRMNMIYKQRFISRFYSHSISYIRHWTNLDKRSIWEMDHVKTANKT